MRLSELYDGALFGMYKGLRRYESRKKGIIDEEMTFWFLDEVSTPEGRKMIFFG